jgi:hypothetical protein
MAKGKFLNQKLGKRVSRKIDMLKSELAARKPSRFASRPGPSVKNLRQK